VLLGFWAAGLPAIMNPGNNIAVAGTEVENANLYFFSWLSFIAVLFLSASLAQDNIGVDMYKTPPKSASWYGLCASSLVVMGSAVRIFNTYDCGSSNSDVLPPEFCARTKFGIAAGVMGFFFALILTYLTQKGLALFAETIATMILLSMWCFGVGYITFGTSPGAKIGNLYFATWISFILCVYLFGSCFREFMQKRVQALSAGSGGGDDNGGGDTEIPNEEDI
jgi:hypothetical protein